MRRSAFWIIQAFTAIIALGAALVWCQAAHAISSSQEMVLFNRKAYAGPGDIVSGAAAWFSCTRAYNKSYAGKLSKLCLIQRASDNATQDLLVKNNGIANIGPIVTFCNATTCSVRTAYDQTGGGNDVTQNAIADQPLLTFSCVGALPCMSLASPRSLTSVSTPLSASTVITFSAVARRTGAFTSYSDVIGGSTMFGGFDTVANKVLSFSGLVTVNATATDSATHAVNYILNGASSFANVDGLSGTTGDAGSAAVGTAFGLGASAGDQLTGDIMEAGMWAGNFTTGQIAVMRLNQKAFWGTP